MQTKIFKISSPASSKSSSKRKLTGKISSKKRKKEFRSSTENSRSPTVSLKRKDNRSRISKGSYKSMKAGTNS
jgi:hypothetical protein